MITQLVTQIAFIPAPEEFFENLVRNELGLARTLNFIDIATGIKNILGDNPKLRISEWKPEKSIDSLTPRRSASWNSEITQTIIKKKPDTVSLGAAEKGSPSELKNLDSSKHRDRKIFSFLNINLWNQAAWSATGFGFDPEIHLPVLTLLFHWFYSILCLIGFAVPRPFNDEAIRKLRNQLS